MKVNGDVQVNTSPELVEMVKAILFILPVLSLVWSVTATPIEARELESSRIDATSFGNLLKKDVEVARIDATSFGNLQKKEADARVDATTFGNLQKKEPARIDATTFTKKEVSLERADALNFNPSQ
ncbi:hypothetical protein EUX98_g1887 [Antrodiella citrinella]|uniref:Uncharacterized protein n=1 Tax=Antrodiella citrinella TaxID=2447956 RepID=A0A4S4N8M3_9APHY|nr:hypothetical protein EUX98_g1887 [Antrodiella citrinella]